MGRHSSGSEWHFYRSVIAWFLPWVVVAAVIAVGLTVGVQQLGGGDDPIVAVDPSPSRSPSPSPSSSPSAKPEPSKTPKASPSPSPKTSPSPGVELITEDIQVQILNGTASADGGERMQERLEGLGFTVVAVDEASLQYEETTVFWSFPASRKAAQALAGRFDWLAEPKPANLSATVDLHVVVGADEG